MANVATGANPATAQRRSCWLFALSATSLVTGAGLIVAVHQFVLKHLWDQSAQTRTLPGVVCMLFGVVGICLPALLLHRKRTFLSLRPSRQWLRAIGVPLAYILTFSLCLEASLRSTTLILQRPFTPTAVVVCEPADMRVEFQGGWKKNLESARGGANPRRGGDRLSAHLFQGFLRHPRRETVTITGGVKRTDDDGVRIVLDVVATEPVRFAVENLDQVEIRRDGQPMGESVSQSGTFQLTITGRLEKDTY